MRSQNSRKRNWIAWIFQQTFHFLQSRWDCFGWKFQVNIPRFYVLSAFQAWLFFGFTGIKKESITYFRFILSDRGPIACTTFAMWKEKIDRERDWVHFGIFGMDAMGLFLLQMTFQWNRKQMPVVENNADFWIKHWQFDIYCRHFFALLLKRFIWFCCWTVVTITHNFTRLSIKSHF